MFTIQKRYRNVSASVGLAPNNTNTINCYGYLSILKTKYVYMFFFQNQIPTRQALILLIYSTEVTFNEMAWCFGSVRFDDIWLCMAQYTLRCIKVVCVLYLYCLYYIKYANACFCCSLYKPYTRFYKYTPKKRRCAAQICHVCFLKVKDILGEQRSNRWPNHITNVQWDIYFKMPQIYHHCQIMCRASIKNTEYITKIWHVTALF